MALKILLFIPPASWNWFYLTI